MNEMEAAAGLPPATATINDWAVVTNVNEAAAVVTTATTLSENLSSEDNSTYGTPQPVHADQTYPNLSPNSPNRPQTTDADDEEQSSPRKTMKTEAMESEINESPSPADTPLVQPQNGQDLVAKLYKKSKKRSKDVWNTTSRKGKKKTKHASNGNHNSKNATTGGSEDKAMITPIPRFPEKNDDNMDLKICLSKAYKAEKVELSEDRLTAGSTKGYRMVRATRGVCEGSWYFEIKVVYLGETGHTRLGWSTDKGDLQAPVGYDGNSFGYRDIDGSKVHKALREKYGLEGYREGDIIGFYINLPDGAACVPKPPRLVWYKGQRYVCALDPMEDPPKIVPGSEISFFKNGICQGVAFRELYGGKYFPAASMYTLPNQPNCVVKFNFGPDFEKFPDDFGPRPVPRPMIEVPYQSHEYDDLSTEKK